MPAGEGPRAPATGPEALGSLAGPAQAGSWRRAHRAAVGALSGAVPVPDDAPAQDRLLAALGRRPPG